MPQSTGSSLAVKIDISESLYVCFRSTNEYHSPGLGTLFIRESARNGADFRNREIDGNDKARKITGARNSAPDLRIIENNFGTGTSKVGSRDIARDRHHRSGYGSEFVVGRLMRMGSLRGNQEDDAAVISMHQKRAAEAIAEFDKAWEKK